MAKKTLTEKRKELVEQISKSKDQLRNLEAKRMLEIGELAKKHKLLDLNDSEFAAAFSELAKRISVADTVKLLIKARQKFNRLNDRMAVISTQLRKQDTRRKIEFGGLVIKAKMDYLPKDIILGALIDAAQKIESEKGSSEYYQSLGMNAFLDK